MSAVRGARYERRRGGLYLVVAALALASFAVPRLVSAQTSNEALAESLFVEARRLIEEGDYVAACPKLVQSNELDPQLGTLLNLGKCYEKNGQTASAWATFTELSRLASRAGQKVRATYAAERIEALEPELAYVTLKLSAPLPDGVTVRLDEKGLSPAALGTPLPLDPGYRQLSVSAPEHQPWRLTLEVATGSRQEVMIPPLEPLLPEPEPAPAPPPVTPLPPPVFVPRPPRSVPIESTSSSWWPVAVAGYSLAGVGVVAGAITGGLALETGGSLDCPRDLCDPVDADDLSRANTLANVSNVSLAVAGAGAILGIIATVVALDDDRVEVSSGQLVIRF